MEPMMTGGGGTTPGLRRERGAALFVTLIVLVLLTLAGIAAMRAADTNNVVAGNFAFKQAAMQASDRAISDAMNNLANITAGGGGNNDVSNRYFSVRQVGVDALGVPTGINWSQVGCVDETGAAVPNCDTSTGSYRIQYYLERQCDSNPTLTDLKDIKSRCDYEVRVASPEQLAIRYRVVVRVRGPRNATGLYEVMISGPATS